MSRMEARWTISELGAEVSGALERAGYEPPTNGQVRAMPDLRTIRYYTTLGLLDRPAEMRGRTALYGRRHLLQLVAVKRLQAAGATLGEVQEQLAGLDDRALARIAQLPDQAPVGQPATAAAEQRRAQPFWASTPSSSPAGAAPPRSDHAMNDRPGGPGVIHSAPSPTGAPTLVAKLALAPGVSLHIESAGDAGAFQRLAAAIDPVALAKDAAPLIEALRRHGLVREVHQEDEG